MLRHPVVACSLPSPSAAPEPISDPRTALSLVSAARDLRQVHSFLIRAAERRLSPSTYASLIRALSKSSAPLTAVSLFVDMLRRSPSPCSAHLERTFPSLFVSCARLGSARAGAPLHSMAVKLGLAPDAYVRNAMLFMYANCGCTAEALELFRKCVAFDVVAYNTMIMGFAKSGLLDEAWKLFEEMPVRTVVTWSTMISGYARNGRSKEAMDLFRRMQGEGVEPNANILVSLLGACANLGALDQGEWIHAYLEKNKFELNPIVITAIIDMYCKCGSVEKALEVFESAENKGLSSWNSMILGLALDGRCREAIGLFLMLQANGLRPNKVTFIGVLMACNHSGMMKKAWYYFSLMANTYDIEPEIEHYGCMVDALGRAGLLKEAEDLVKTMPMKPDSIIWGALLSACRTYKNTEIGARAAKRVLELDPQDSGGYVILSNTFAGSGEFGDSVGTRVRMKKSGVRKDPGCSVIEVNGLVHEFVASGVLHPQAKEIYELLDGLDSVLRMVRNVAFSGMEFQGLYWC
ncbi:pentatricopeptide repeat-containing protein At2g42920, chloroplastic-like [Ananas comosus]|uniref:Pentatricopeptide repeat-containing protein At2g42920, chloroplastic-like n=1 Tax=Ananas comosus TaxID=4615 RepID=A0A6P5FG06_ANACO|nr:pentatricopeptide repeat-containing protein At2g42920, chloroplastic-like [Ananas comosus]XP_020092389.1 pentatricopeptide repeat-containing protein At2g42920, chloroplastic-like [Ananas comosus]